MNTPPPVLLRAGDYARQFPADTESDRQAGREMMKRNGCRSIRFESIVIGYTSPEEGEAPIYGTMVAHGYVSRVDGPNVEQL